MGWFCDTPKAKAELKKCYDNDCPGCHKCIAIEESGWAKAQYAKPTPAEPHPLLDEIKEKFGGKEIG